MAAKVSVKIPRAVADQATKWMRQWLETTPEGQTEALLGLTVTQTDAICRLVVLGLRSAQAPIALHPDPIRVSVIPHPGASARPAPLLRPDFVDYPFDYAKEVCAPPSSPPVTVAPLHVGPPPGSVILDGVSVDPRDVVVRPTLAEVATRLTDTPENRRVAAALTGLEEKARREFLSNVVITGAHRTAADDERQARVAVLRAKYDPKGVYDDNELESCFGAMYDRFLERGPDIAPETTEVLAPPAPVPAPAPAPEPEPAPVPAPERKPVPSAAEIFASWGPPKPLKTGIHRPDPAPGFTPPTAPAEPKPRRTRNASAAAAATPASRALTDEQVAAMRADFESRVAAARARGELVSAADIPTAPGGIALEDLSPEDRKAAEEMIREGRTTSPMIMSAQEYAEWRDNPDPERAANREAIARAAAERRLREGR